MIDKPILAPGQSVWRYALHTTRASSVFTSAVYHVPIVSGAATFCFATCAFPNKASVKYDLPFPVVDPGFPVGGASTS